MVCIRAFGMIKGPAIPCKALNSPFVKAAWPRQVKTMAVKMELPLTQPDDWHLHLRDGDMLEGVVSHSASHFGRAIVMPNLKPPVTTTAAAMTYRESILKALPPNSNFTPLMTLYLTDNTHPDEIKNARKSGAVFAVKLYPAGATTNSQDGVTDLIGNCLPVLKEMVEQNMPLLVHGEVTDQKVDIFDREKVFIDTVLRPLTQKLPELKIVMEHITTQDAVRFVESCKEGSVAATVTPQHLLLNRNSLFQGGLQPHNYCLPVLKRELHRQAIVSAVTSGSKHYFLGTDSAPHERLRKECSCGCAGIYNAPVALSLYAKVFEEAGALEKLEAFTSFNGPDFYGLPRNTSKIKLSKTPWKVPESYTFKFGEIIPMFAEFSCGETILFGLHFERMQMNCKNQVLEEGLEPHPNLKALNIGGFKGVVLPSWMGHLQNLVRVSLDSCRSCTSLPPLGKLPLLEVLSISEMHSVKCIVDGEGVFVGGGSAANANAIQGGCCSSWFLSLQILEIRGMTALEEWWSPASTSSEEEENHGRTTQAFPCLEELRIERCPKLKAIPYSPCMKNVELSGCYKLEAIPCLPCVQNLKLCDCNEMILRSIPNLGPRSLLTLEIHNFNEMTHLPEGTFINSSSSTAALQSLVISYCYKLKSLNGEIQNLTALTSLNITSCNELDSLSELEGLLQKLASFTQLNIWNCPRLKCLPVMEIQGGFNNSFKLLAIGSCPSLTSVSEGLQYLTSLQKLEIINCRELELMSRDDQEEDGFQHLISLQTSTLRGLPKLRALPEGMQHLTMLQSLKINECKNLRMLPESLQHLTSLQSLEITYCHPDLHKRCKRDEGEDWHIISHIPQLNIFHPVWNRELVSPDERLHQH